MERRALEQARQRASELQRQLDDLRAEVVEFNRGHPQAAIAFDGVAAPGAGDARTVVDRFVSDARTAESNARGKLQAARLTVRLAAAVDALGNGGGGRAATAQVDAAPPASASPPSVRAHQPAEPVQTFVDRVLGRLDGSAPDAQRAGVAEVAARLLVLPRANSARVHAATLSGWPL